MAQTKTISVGIWTIVKIFQKMPQLFFKDYGWNILCNLYSNKLSLFCFDFSIVKRHNT